MSPGKEHVRRGGLPPVAPSMWRRGNPETIEVRKGTFLMSVLPR